MSVPYHRLPRVDANWRWWRPLVALAVFLGFYVLSQIVIGIAYLVPIATQRGPEGLDDLLTKLSEGALDPTDPLVLSMSLVSLVVLLPAIMLSTRIARLGPYGLLSSIRLRVRWGWLGWCLLPLLVLGIVMFLLQSWGMFVFDAGLHWNTAAIGQSTVSVQTLTVTILLVVLLVPFQAAAEEYVFRGFLMQTIGSWIPVRVVSTVVAVGVSTVLFAVLHVPNGYNIWGILDVGSFGLVAAVIVLRTGGLEATVLQHALNNIMIFVLQAPGWSEIDLTGEGSQGTPAGFLVTLATSLGYWGLIELMAHWRRLDRRFPGQEAPRFHGPAPRWAGGRQWLRPGGPGWSGAPALGDGSVTSGDPALVGASAGAGAGVGSGAGTGAGARSSVSAPASGSEEGAGTGAEAVPVEKSGGVGPRP
ncbi:CPBP family intramembrane glutamic endopeptidase [Curtobacterium sp. MCSS17_015]|uniref:CPBP family intramembrane glutamic endopeptidase n=1 Tax=Curtobacterium sp. MCSS17_015 TaxID=2175666 RepID=UPI0011B3AD4B|nr:CPBP family intramembrane glutamic endopeptidase [Curtobacterium sp. MCSS17_015]WIB27096.1 lysostaphin resistance A-like protein [Curtobacterium sp. MCSS17_015]